MLKIAILLPLFRPVGIAFAIVNKDTEQPVLKGRKALKGAISISPAYAVDLV